MKFCMTRFGCRLMLGMALAGSALTVKEDIVMAAQGYPLLEAPSYPIFGILQQHPALARAYTHRAPYAIPEDALMSLRHYRTLYKSDGVFMRNVLAGLKKVAPDVRMIAYIGSYYTYWNEIASFEPDYIDGVAIAAAAQLQAPLSSESTSIVHLQSDENGSFPFLAATARKSIETDNARFIFWIQINDEKMWVLDVDADARTLKVERGYRSAIATHRAGDRVFVPCYQGWRDKGPLLKNRSNDGYPYAAGSPAHGYSQSYYLDPGHEKAQEFLAMRVQRLLDKGYDGVWLDNLRVDPVFLCDPLGKKLTYMWNPHAARNYGVDDFATAVLEMIGYIRRHTRTASGHIPYLAGNGAEGKYHLKACKRLFGNGMNTGGLDAQCFEDSFVHPVAKNPAQDDVRFFPHHGARWLNSVRKLQDAEKNGYKVIAMLGAAGYITAWYNPDLENYDQLERFSWCSYLLAVSKDRHVRFGRPAVLWKKHGRIAFVPMGDFYFYDIGDPVQSRPIPEYQIAPGCYARRFQRAMVIVNTAKRSQRIHLQEKFPETFRRMHREDIEVPSGDAAILMYRD